MGIDLDDIYVGDESEKPSDQTTLIKKAAFYKLCEEISDWKLEARLEDNNRYFFHINEVQRIEQGKRSFVIGRKGCGKTAISEYLCNQVSPLTFSVKLTFKNFPFNELYALKDYGYTGSHQYITVWKFLIYSHICQLMAQNEGIESSVREKLHRAYVENQAPTLPRRINRWLDRDFGLELFGVSANIGAPARQEAQNISLIGRVNKLEDIVLASLDAAKYLIVFDELDEDYKNITDQDQFDKYTSLITGLFKATQDVRSVFSGEGHNLLPIVFLRDDIYELIQDSDKTKWNDLKIELDWDAERIKKLIAFRISRAIDPLGVTLSFDDAWHKLFSRTDLRLGNGGRKTLHSFDFIARSTHLRPRDFIQYLKSCCEQVVNSDNDLSLISPRIIRKVDTAFSNYLKSELADEIHGIVPDINAIFDIISQLRKWSFSVQEFTDLYNRQKKLTNLKERDPVFVLQILFLFSVIGNHWRGGREMFRYKHKEHRLNFDDPIVVHRGLFKALQIGI
uniref:ATPase n=2 Tax=Polaromonas sp. H1N TaxID=1840283 RepID=A0A2S1FJ38_9BURK|nr:hypothetical protein pH1NP1_p020 [Polaromonas sp. H1N]